MTDAPEIAKLQRKIKALEKKITELSIDPDEKDRREAVAALDAVLVGAGVIQRNIARLSANAFTHNDPRYIAKIEQALAFMVEDFAARIEQARA